MAAPAAKPAVTLPPSPLPSRHAALKDIAAGTAAGLVSVLACHPLDTLRVRLQTAPSGRFTGALDVLAQTVKREGARALYKGMAMPLLAQGVQKATMFYSFGMARRTIIQYSHTNPAAGPLPIWQLGLCGSFAGVCNAVVANPFELVRNRLQVQYARRASDAQYRGPVDAARQIIRTAGVRSLWLGLGPMMLRDAPGLAAWYGTFEGVRRALLPPGSDPSQAPVWKTLLSGASAGVAFWVCAFPQDTIKNIIQTRGMDMRMHQLEHAAGVAPVAAPSSVGVAAPSAAAVSTEGFVSTGARLVREEGFKRLWRGFSIAALRGIPGASSTFLTYTVVSNHLNKLEQQHLHKQLQR
jgi:solute carrier family 25 carnitine/acylcarnitine transporter 20/29